MSAWEKAKSDAMRKLKLPPRTNHFAPAPVLGGVAVVDAGALDFVGWG
jgi:hypothetical protein